MPGRTQPPVHGSAVFAMASESPQIMLRQAMTSPMFASTPRNVAGAGDLGRLDQEAGDEVELHGEARAAVDEGAREGIPVRGKKLFAFSTSPCTNTSSQGTNTLSITKMASFSSSRLESG